MTRIGIIVGSTRPNRRGATIGGWVLERALARADADYELLDLAEIALPMLDEPEPAAMGTYHHPHTRTWSQTVSSLDGFVFVTPEYNHSFPGALKNAIDYLFTEWNDKAAGFVSYGINGGVRATEHLRNVCAEVKLAGVRGAVALAVFEEFQGAGPIDIGVFAPGDRHSKALDRMLDDVLAWSTALSSLRLPPITGSAASGRPGELVSTA
jgi:NAD(P)H-dependent FMN reductase